MAPTASEKRKRKDQHNAKESRKAYLGKVTPKIVRLYSDAAFQGSFGGVNRFRDYLSRKENISLTFTEARNILREVPNYEMHVANKANFKRRHIRYKGAGIDFQADLGFMPKFGRFSTFLLVVDLYSNYIYVEALLSKTAEAVKKALNKIIQENRLFKVTSLGTDAGGEFIGNREFLKSKNITLITLRGKNKAFQAENFIRIFKSALYKYLRFHHSKDWPRATPIITRLLNTRRQKNLGPFTPADINSPFEDPVSRPALEKLRRSRHEKEESKMKTKEPDYLKINSFVYLGYQKATLYKGFQTKRGAIYKIVAADRSQRPYLYTLAERDGTKLDGKYYGAELKKAPNPAKIDHEIDEVLKQRTVNGKKEYFVKFLYYPDK